MKHYGDITKLNGYELPVVDIITGGSPCQDLSVAGKRAGLAGERSGLFMEQIRLIKEMRDGYIRQLRSRGADVDIRHIRPRYMVWENVPGAFSSNGGADFKAVLEETAKIADENAVIPGLAPKQKWSPAGAIMGDGWSIAWRVHDAQFWGVPQRRKRIALVADFGGATALEILFERKSLSRDTSESGEERQGVATDVEGSVDKAISFQERGGKPGGGKGILIQNERTGALSTLNNQSVCCLNNQGGSVMGVSENITGALRAQEHGHQPIVNEVYCLQGNGIDRADTAGCNGKGWRENQSYTLNTIDRPAVSYQKTTGAMASGYDKLGTQEAANDMYVVQSLETFHCTNETDKVQTLKARDYKDPQVIAYGVDAYNQTQTEEQAKALNSAATDSDHIPCVYGLDRAAFNQGENAKYNFSIDEEKVGAQVAQGPGAVYQSVVRRLTPMECERLQGYPDRWTDIGEWIDSKGKKHKDADSPRYKALGNSIALPFWQWMASRMVRYIDHEPTMASLFDGIGGFPLVFSRCGCKPIWASEIEEFPIAVTKKRFGG